MQADRANDEVHRQQERKSNYGDWNLPEKAGMEDHVEIAYACRSHPLCVVRLVA